MSEISLIRVPESEVLTPTGEMDARLSGRIAAQFINRSVSELTRKNYLSNLRQFILFSGKKDARDVQVEDVLAWRASMEKRNFAPHTISTKIATLSALFAYFRDYGVIDRSPATSKISAAPRVAAPESERQSVVGQGSSLSALHDQPG